MNILLWAPFGAGDHYWGPGMSAYRLYKKGLPSDVNLYLAHGYRKQRTHSDTFSGMYFISDLLGGGVLRQVLFLICSYVFIRKNHEKFDAIHVLGLNEISFRPALWFERIGVPTFVKITGDRGGVTGSSKISRLLGISTNRLSKLNEISGYISISDVIRGNLNNAGVVESKIHNIPNGVDVETFKPVNPDIKAILRKEYGLKDRFTVVFVGGLSSRKQPLMLVKAVQRLATVIGDKLQLVLLGPSRDDSTLEELNRYIYENKLQDLVCHVDHSDSPQVYYQMSNVFCLPSKSEGMSNSLLEAMSSGLPSIVTPISGSIDLIQDNECGIFAECEEDVANAIYFYFINNVTSQNHGENARNLIVEKYNSSLVLKKHLGIFFDT